MSDPLISIITPTYNHEKYIAECIRSVLSQSYQDWEMLIVDDGSTDATADIIKRFRDPRIRYLRQENQGAYKLGATYNKALKESRGDLIAILEGDDFWPPDKLAVQAPYFSSPDIILTYGDCIVTNEHSDKLFYRGAPSEPEIRDNAPAGSALKGFLRAENFIYAQTVMIRKDALLKIGGFIQPDYLNLVDFPTWCRLCLEGEFRGIPRLLGYWRRNIKSLTMANPSIISGPFIRYIADFTARYQERIGKLGIDVNIGKHTKYYEERLRHAERHRDFLKALTLLIYGYNNAARRHFGLYLRQKNNNIFKGIISLLCLFFSYTDLLRILLPALGIHSSGFFTALKRRIVE
ncbi:MAG: glycosyltransferase [Planctomycetota bacterium]